MTHLHPDLAPQSPGGMLTSDFTPRCCCGRNHCAYLEYNDAALRALEDDLRRAAEAGQSLLARHEAYILDAEDERRRMAATIDKLESDKKELDASNTRIIDENRTLLDQLEQLNNTVSTSDTHVQSLNATLQSTRQELSRLNALAARTSQLEAQLSFMEIEQASLHEKLAASQDDQRSAIDRWKDAERTIGDLQEQIDRIEAESKEESERHTEVMNRFERRRDVERQLENAAGRLKGAAAATTMGKCSDGNNNVVSHFVKDILADNASLQMGIMELREMLMGSNDEVQKLRQLMIDHQEVALDEHPDTSKATLETDLERSAPAELDSVPALHVHHHYHEASNAVAPTRQRSIKARRPRRRRLDSGTSTPRSGLETPRTPWTPTRTQPPSSVATILSQTSVSIPPPHTSFSHRLSTQSTNTRSSNGPPSELSSPHPSMFDFLSDSSRPTSPDSVDVFSPKLLTHRIKANTSAPQRGSPTALIVAPNSRKTPTIPYHPPTNHDRHPPTSSASSSNTIIEAPEDDNDDDSNLSHLSAEAATPTSETYTPTPGLRRCTSHESMFSIAPLPQPPKQLRKQSSQLFRGAGGLKAKTSLGATSLTIGNASSSSSSSANAPKSAGNGRAASASGSGAMSTLSSSLQQSSAATGASNTLGKRVGGWVFGKWGVGVAPMASTGDLRAKAANSAREERPPKEERPPGVNQKGPLRTMKAAKRLSSHVEPVSVDEGLLQESLGEG
ncbi:MAG: hypothetical protein Q9168_004001 [Polycauliona sp. 1 TL-2023]